MEIGGLAEIGWLEIGDWITEYSALPVRLLISA
jgi:hypothetical protein